MKNVKTMYIIGTLGLGLFFTGHMPAAHATDCFKVDSVFEEGGAARCEEVGEPVKIAQTGCLDMQSFYSEGHPYACNAEAKNKSIDLAYNSEQGFFTEGFDNSGTQHATLRTYNKEALQAQPAAGSTR